MIGRVIMIVVVYKLQFTVLQLPPGICWGIKMLPVRRSPNVADQPISCNAMQALSSAAIL